MNKAKLIKELTPLIPEINVDILKHNSIELKVIAKERGIPGYYKMSKPELIEELNKPLDFLWEKPERDYSFVKNNHKNSKFVKAINLDRDNEETFYNSLHTVSEHLGVNSGIVKMVCEGLNNCKSGVSKMDGTRYRFEYIDQLPPDYNSQQSLKKKLKKKKI